MASAADAGAHGIAAMDIVLAMIVCVAIATALGITVFGIVSHGH